MHIGNKIKELRNLKLWTQAKLAVITKVSERTVRRLEATGKAESATLLSILNALDTNLQNLKICLIMKMFLKLRANKNSLIQSFFKG
ncbi:helix-turn-helix domain-containing protein [Bacillus chungangensis]|uniref:Transcriptional regulator with XRE-family HTH domain n=1 Tax=Bacillus chungangensis TaxID=587633 RepID=A0ABT9WTA5_9BACI|nr:helix-turn-helix transcriptional regulator [Bacillus chungangensis]MDQ0176457.1 transcriptional regulator with XRE-family HTH domain [Bacillus chungangensis]